MCRPSDSVPVRLIGQRVRVLLHACEVNIYDGRMEVARHERLVAKGAVRLERDHYLKALVRKPGALPGATALEQARAAGKFTPVHVLCGCRIAVVRSGARRPVLVSGGGPGCPVRRVPIGVDAVSGGCCIRHVVWRSMVAAFSCVGLLVRVGQTARVEGLFAR
ncbi:Mu transposase domain-containing protein [Streptomyces liliiviolaceus]|uniref:Mu transposase domain-containing protein n=1 Tax=Streptomyces liliiviolaceus TaxID=2823109 RepID=UPI00389A209A